MAKQIVVFKLTGKRPLLCHSPRGMKPTSSGLGTKNIPTPEAEAAMGTYLDPENKGRFMFPSVSVRNCLIQAAKSSRLKFGKVNAASVLSASVFPVEEFIPLVHPETLEPLKEYTIDLRPVVVQKSRILRARPRFDQWALLVPLEINDSLVTSIVDGVVKILNIGGEILGIGDYRVQKTGIYGQFFAEVYRNSV